MKKDFKFFAQISTSHSSVEKLDLISLRSKLQKAQAILPFSGLIVGSLENPAVYNELTRNKNIGDPETYLWYNLLSDYPGQSEETTIVDYRGRRCQNWFGWGNDARDEISETFLFSCPNNPYTSQTTLKALSNLLEKYPFDGVFLDKFRFPSPANKLNLTFSCFCPHCREKAAAQGLDLDAVIQSLSVWRQVELNGSVSAGDWLDTVTVGKEILKRFIQFRLDSILDLVKQVREMTNFFGVKLGLDLFTPTFADLVGESYTKLAPYADWAKPMVYQYAMGPAGIRLETKALIEGLQSEFSFEEASIFTWARTNLPWFTRETYFQLRDKKVPLSWIAREIREAVLMMPSLPVYMGLEAVSFPGVIDISPEEAGELFNTAYTNGANGAVLSWDLMHMPIENLKAIKEQYDARK